jgi:hypothetical protein
MTNEYIFHLGEESPVREELTNCRIFRFYGMYTEIVNGQVNDSPTEEGLRKLLELQMGLLLNSLMGKVSIQGIKLVLKTELKL